MIEGQYQWIRGDFQGTVESITDSNNEWVNFQSGRRIKSDLLQEYMLPINHGEQIVNIPGVDTKNAVANSDYNFSNSGDDDDIIIDSGTGEVINTRQIRQQHIGLPGQINTVINQVPITVEKKQVSPITILISKAIKEKVKISYEFEIEIPKQDVYNIIDQSFDVDLNQEIIDVVLSTINIKTLKDSVEEAINNTIKSYYKSK